MESAVMDRTEEKRWQALLQNTDVACAERFAKYARGSLVWDRVHQCWMIRWWGDRAWRVAKSYELQAMMGWVEPVIPKARRRAAARLAKPLLVGAPAEYTYD